MGWLVDNLKEFKELMVVSYFLVSNKYQQLYSDLVHTYLSK